MPPVLARDDTFHSVALPGPVEQPSFRSPPLRLFSKLGHPPCCDVLVEHAKINLLPYYSTRLILPWLQSLRGMRWKNEKKLPPQSAPPPLTAHERVTSVFLKGYQRQILSQAKVITVPKCTKESLLLETPFTSDKMTSEKQDWCFHFGHRAPNPANNTSSLQSINCSQPPQTKGKLSLKLKINTVLPCEFELPTEIFYAVS